MGSNPGGTQWRRRESRAAVPGDSGGVDPDSVVKSILGECPVLTRPLPRVSPWGVEHGGPAKLVDFQLFRLYTIDMIPTM